MKQILPKNNFKRGFTLVELLVVIAIIAILAVIGLTIFTNVQKNARDARRKADVEAIAKAYEIYRSGSSYQALTAANFASGGIPKDPNPSKGDYFSVVDTGGQGFKVCASLDNNPSQYCNTPAVNCYCQVSAQGTIPQGASLSGMGSTMGLGGSSSSSCDPNGTLLSGLVGYWKMDDNPSTNVSDSSGHGYNGTFTGFGSYWASPGKLGPTSGNFPAGNNNVVSTTLVSPSLINNQVTVAVWVNISSLTSPYNGGTFITNKTGPYGALLGLENGNFRWLINGSTSSNLASTASAPSIGSWYLVVGTYDGSTQTIYINYSNKTVRNNVTITPNTISDFGLGSCQPCGGQYTAGQLDDIRVYNRALSDLEVSTLYSGGNGCAP